MRHNLWLTAYILSLIRAPGSTNQDDVRIVEPFFSGCNRLFGWRLRSFGRALILNPHFKINIYTNTVHQYDFSISIYVSNSRHNTTFIVLMKSCVLLVFPTGIHKHQGETCDFLVLAASCIPWETLCYVMVLVCP